MNNPMAKNVVVCIACALIGWNVSAQETGGVRKNTSVESVDLQSILDGQNELIRQAEIDRASQKTLLGDVQRAREEVDALKSTVAETNKRAAAPQHTVEGREAVVGDLSHLLSQTQSTDQEPGRKPRVTVGEIQSREGRPLVVLPPSIPNADPRISESMTIASNTLHGFSAEDLRRSAAARLAKLSGAESPTSHVSISGFGEYRIGAGDVVDFISLDNERLSRTLTVRYDGQVSLPLIPDIKVAGRSRAEAEDLIRSAYAKSILDPEISLAVIQPNSKIYTMIGDVERPGIYNYTREISLTQSLSLAGGRARQTFGEGNNQFVSVAGQITKAFVVRTIAGDRKVFAYDLRNIDQPGAHDGETPIYYGDLVYVPKGVNLVYLLGEQSVQRIIEMTDGLSLLQMLALSGGFNTSTARLRNVVLLRAVDDEHTDIHLINVRDILKNTAQDIPLVAGDIIYIPRKRMLKLQDFVIRFTNTISPLLGLYQQAVDSYYTYDINKETLELLEGQNSGVTVNPLVKLPQSLK